MPQTAYTAHEIGRNLFELCCSTGKVRFTGSLRPHRDKKMAARGYLTFSTNGEKRTVRRISTLGGEPMKVEFA